MVTAERDQQNQLRDQLVQLANQHQQAHDYAGAVKELEKIRRVISNQVPQAPHETLLVLDATGGQNGLSQASGFTEAAGCTGIILAKLDGTAKGGILVAIARELSIPVPFIGVGESIEDLIPFSAEAFLDSLFVEGPI